MGTRTERIGKENIVITTMIPPLNIEHDPQEAAHDFITLSRSMQGKRVRILDFTDVQVNFGDVVIGLQDDPALKEKDVILYFVGTDELVQFAAQAAAGDLYGKLDARAFTSIDKALAAARSALR